MHNLIVGRPLFYGEQPEKAPAAAARQTAEDEEHPRGRMGGWHLILIQKGLVSGHSMGIPVWGDII